MSVIKDGHKYYRAHEVGYPDDEVLNIKVGTSVGGKEFDKIERMDTDSSKKESTWYYRVFGYSLVPGGLTFKKDELND